MKTNEFRFITIQLTPIQAKYLLYYLIRSCLKDGEKYGCPIGEEADNGNTKAIQAMLARDTAIKKLSKNDRFWLK